MDPPRDGMPGFDEIGVGFFLSEFPLEESLQNRYDIDF
jgi:hypothetical protein